MAGVPISTLGVEQLQSIGSQLEQEIQGLSASLKGLRMAGQKFGESKEALTSIGPESSGRPMLVPMSGSLYVPGEVGNVDKVLVDVGTGYFVEKVRADNAAMCTM